MSLNLLDYIVSQDSPLNPSQIKALKTLLPIALASATVGGAGRYMITSKEKLNEQKLKKDVLERGRTVVDFPIYSKVGQAQLNNKLLKAKQLSQNANEEWKDLQKNAAQYKSSSLLGFLGKGAINVGKRLFRSTLGKVTGMGIVGVGSGVGGAGLWNYYKDHGHLPFAHWYGDATNPVETLIGDRSDSPSTIPILPTLQLMAAGGGLTGGYYLTGKAIDKARKRKQKKREENAINDFTRELSVEQLLGKKSGYHKTAKALNDLYKIGKKEFNSDFGKFSLSKTSELEGDQGRDSAIRTLMALSALTSGIFSTKGIIDGYKNSDSLRRKKHLAKSKKLYDYDRLNTDSPVMFVPASPEAKSYQTA